ncbi:MAG TPA: PA0069 family radical SAM protein [Opitutales bacterium]|nr:PA0069 family radical SAM protein [Opitutales bacterium]
MNKNQPQPIRGRGARFNPTNRFESLQIELDPEEAAQPDKPQTRYFDDNSGTIISRNNSPDVGFSASVNPYRGCEHGCIYCYARPTHEFLGFSSGLDFESQILAKRNAPELLRHELSSKKWIPQVLAMSGITDPYQPIERKLEITRKCLETLAAFKNPVSLITKNHLITRDIDVLKEMANEELASANISVTSLNPKLTAILEPRTSRPELRLRAIEKLAAAGIPVNVMIAPIIPGLNDEEIPAIADAAASAGARTAAFTMVRLPYAVAPLFEEWLEQHFPLRKKKILDRIRSMRNGKLNDSDFASRMRGKGIFAEQIRQLFHVSIRRAGLDQPRPQLRTDLFRIPGRPKQLDLF